MRQISCVCAFACAFTFVRVFVFLYNICLLPVKVEFWETIPPVKHRTNSERSYFILHCSSSHSSIKDCRAIDGGVYVYEQPSRINCCVAECFVAKLRWCLIEQVCQGSKVWSALAFQRTGYCAKMYKNLPLRIHACIQDRALVCARPPECGHL